MSMTPDWRSLALSDTGRTLIEASAGTGKTWTIGVLYLRLLLERGLSPRQIVVATYTNAAAEELKERLRLRIEASFGLAHEAFHQAPSRSESDKYWLYERWEDQPELRRSDASRLALALAELDIAPIGTLHRLCSRILGEHPFAARTSFQIPNLIDTSSMVEELAIDVQRIIYDPAPITDSESAVIRASKYLKFNPLSRSELASYIKSLMLPGVVVNAPEVGEAPSFGDLKPLEQVISNDSLWRKGATLRSELMEMHQALEAAELITDSKWINGICKKIQSQTGLLKGAKESNEVLAVLAQVEAFLTDLLKWVEGLHLQFMADLQRWARAQMDARLLRANQLGFDDLLTRVLEAMAPNANGERALADALFSVWPVAMIDEFQDTDPTQYGILDAIYRTNDKDLRGRLLLIGDPKQAIYRFRGGDIHTYERAKAEVSPENLLSLKVNHRSSYRYVAAMNAFYKRVGEKLGAATSETPICYEDVSSRAEAKDVAFSNEGAAASALVFFKTDESYNESEALYSCANRIVEMLSETSSYRIEGRPLKASDICVLVPSNKQATRMTQYLRDRNVPTVNRGRGSVFDSETASELLLILDAVFHSDSPEKLRAAVSTSLWGMGYHELRAIKKDDSDWRRVAMTIQQWHVDWESRGILVVINQLIARVAQRQLATNAGERVMTDLRHLAELLQDVEEQSDGIASVLRWFAEQMDQGDAEEDAGEARALRLESDAQCAQVMTLHASKGLEFPLVFLPLMWKHSVSTQRTGRNPKIGLIAKDDGQREMVVDDANLASVALEDQEERFRVLYVALTRARYASYVWLTPEFKKPPSYAIHGMAPLSIYESKLLAADKESQQDQAEKEQSSDLKFSVEDGWFMASKLRLSPQGNTSIQRHARPLPAERRGALPMRHSFTTLTRDNKAWEVDPFASALDEALPDDVSVTITSDVGDRIVSLTTHPSLEALKDVAGTEFGNAIHGMLENREVGVRMLAQTALVQGYLAEYAIKHPTLSQAALVHAIAQRLDEMLEADLDGQGLRLADIAARDIRCEMEFNYLLQGASVARLRDACAKAGDPELVPMRDSVLRGLMNGKIDVLFRHGEQVHVLDWKTNRSGNKTSQALENYTADVLQGLMDEHHYRFQALLYTVAVERYLKQRLGARYSRDQHLGDSWYVFVRAAGLRLADGSLLGVWRHRFPDAILDAAQRELSVDSAQGVAA